MELDPTLFNNSATEIFISGNFMQSFTNMAVESAQSSENG